MLRLGNVSSRGDGVRGQRFSADLRSPVLFIGKNGAGKTSRLLAVQAVLEERRRGGIPKFLGDDAEAIGNVIVSAELLDGDIVAATVQRSLGAKHSVEIDRFGNKIGKVNDCEEVLDVLLGGRRPEFVPASRFIDLDEKQQRALLERVAGSAVQDLTTEEALRTRFAAIEVSREDGKTMRFGQEKISFLVRSITESGGGLEGARNIVKDWAKEARAKNQAAKKARKQFEEFDSPEVYGSVASFDQTLAEHRAKLTGLEKRRFGFQQAASRRQEIEARLAKRATAVSQREAARQRLPQYEAMLRDAEAAASAARESLSSMSAPSSGSSNDDAIARIAAEVAKLESGTCPLCGQAGPLIRAVRLRKKKVLSDMRSDGGVSPEAYKEAEAQYNQKESARKQAQKDLDALRDEIIKLDGIVSFSESEQELPPEEEFSSEEIGGEIAALEQLIRSVSGQRDVVLRQEEQSALRLRNLQDIAESDDALSLLDKANEVLSALATEIAQKAHAPVEEAANKVMAYMYGDEGLRFSFRQEPFGFGAKKAGRFIPYSSLSESQQLMVGVAMSIAIDSLEQRPFRPLLVDGLERVDHETLFSLISAASQMMRDGLLSNFAGTARFDSLEDFSEAEKRHANDRLDNTGLLVDLVTEDGQGGVITFGKGKAEVVSPLSDDEYIFCTGGGSDKQVRLKVGVHRARGCTCGADEQEMRGRTMRSALKEKKEEEAS